MNDSTSIDYLFVLMLALILAMGGLTYLDEQRDDQLTHLIEQRCSDQAYYDQLPETVERPVLTLECE